MMDRPNADDGLLVVRGLHGMMFRKSGLREGCTMTTSFAGSEQQRH